MGAIGGQPQVMPPPQMQRPPVGSIGPSNAHLIPTIDQWRYVQLMLLCVIYYLHWWRFWFCGLSYFLKNIATYVPWCHKLERLPCECCSYRILQDCLFVCLLLHRLIDSFIHSFIHSFIVWGRGYVCACFCASYSLCMYVLFLADSVPVLLFLQW